MMSNLRRELRLERLQFNSPFFYGIPDLRAGVRRKLILGRGEQSVSPLGDGGFRLCLALIQGEDQAGYIRSRHRPGSQRGLQLKRERRRILIR
jgi:hypothetical protein